MARIHVLDDNTIDQIAAGEVVERPGNVVKELVENAMDSGADAITVEIKDGGIEFVRVTDNGSGILKDDIKNAFLRHATSKIHSVKDLQNIHSMGFRGEALASIAAVSKVELISKCPDELMGHRYVVEGGFEKSFDEVGAPDGTTVIMRNLFYNTPVRRKFLKSATTEGGYVAVLMEHLALCRPDISYTFIQNGKPRFSTSGNGDLKEVIYRVYGRDTSREIIPIICDKDGVTIEGYLGTPVNNRANRNYENYFLNRRYIKSDVIAKGLEEGYRAFMMQHRFPFCVLHITMDTEEVDVNVHPTKMDVRFRDQQGFFSLLSDAVSNTLSHREMITSCELSEKKKEKEAVPRQPEPFEGNRREEVESSTVCDPETIDIPKNTEQTSDKITEEILFQEDTLPIVNKILSGKPETNTSDILHGNIIKERETILVERPVQLEMFDTPKVLSKESRKKYRLIGQVFDTYWMFELDQNLYFLDQHAAHEKVNYERFMKRLNENAIYKQQLNPPLVISVSKIEEQILIENREYFEEMGFEIEEFGGKEYTIRTLPLDLYQENPREMFLAILNELESTGLTGTPELIRSRIATMACKASVKGNSKMTFAEAEVLLDELLTLENPYHCPHGRPTIISMSKYEIEKKFKRIV